MTMLLWVAGAVVLLLLHWYMVAGACAITREEERARWELESVQCATEERARVVEFLRDWMAVHPPPEGNAVDAIERGDHWLTHARGKLT